MKKLTLDKLKKLMSETDYEIQDLVKIIDVKGYADYEEKEVIIHTSILGALDTTEDNIEKINYLRMKLYFELSIIKHYTNIDISELDNVEDIDVFNERIRAIYDFLSRRNVVRFVKAEMEGEYVALKEILDKEVAQLEKMNTGLLSAVKIFSSELKNLFDPNLMEGVVEKMDGLLNREELKDLKKMVEKI